MSSNAGVYKSIESPNEETGSSDRGFEQEILDTTMRVTTPENISFQYQLVGPFRRIIAYSLDVLISVFGYILLIILASLVYGFVLLPLAEATGTSGLLDAISYLVTGMTLIGYFIVYWFYGALMETYFNGQTVGKKSLRMRVISTDGHAIDGVQATLRNFFRLMDTMPVVSFNALVAMEGLPQVFVVPSCLFGLLIMTLSPKYQRIGDLVAGTMVVNEESSLVPDLAKFDDERVAQLAELIPTSFVAPHSMAKAIADYVDQRRYLPFQRASEVAGHLAVPLLERFGIARDTDHDLFLCSLYYKTFVADLNVDSDRPVAGISVVSVASEPTVAQVVESETRSLSDTAFRFSNPDEPKE